MMGRVTLEPFELLWGSQAACMRQTQNIRNNAKPAYGNNDKNPWQDAVAGALGEMALAKFLNVYWPGKGKMCGDDVGRGDRAYQCRTSPYSFADLRITKKDDDDARFYLVTGKNRDYTIQGWLLAADGKRDEYWHSNYQPDRPAYWVPQDKLNIGD